MLEALCVFGFMSAVLVALQAARVAKLRTVEERFEEDPEAAKIVMLFAEADRMHRAA